MKRMTRKQRALEQAFWRCNKIGIDAMPNIIIENYKALETATVEEKEAMYNYLCDRLGFTRRPMLTDEQLLLLETNGFLHS